MGRGRLMARELQIVDAFAPEADALRAVFDARFANPRGTGANRFVWDWWHVPGQYTALRTPAWTYFPTKLYEAFHRRLVAWGRETLGCHDISPPWLSCYVEGCRQELHGDLPHGPWAFVFSLTNWRQRVFRGGETLMLREHVLDFWADFASVQGVEEGELIRAIEPRFGRLTVFDPRFPHGVRQVTGTHDPREGRIVIHGWFVQPRPFVRGPLAGRALTTRIEDLGGRLGGWLGALPIAGLYSVAFDVDRRGYVRDVRALSDTTRVPRSHESARKRLVRRIRDDIATWRFGSQRGASRVTLPLVFERG
ncbi:MAG: 2OG-Fe(II) oxygenase [Kofleriaceae bacterium]|nr:2OG-Fe(II) oxygenase [Kofleriaceae bacterium]